MVIYSHDREPGAEPRLRRVAPWVAEHAPAWRARPVRAPPAAFTGRGYQAFHVYERVERGPGPDGGRRFGCRGPREKQL